MNPFVLSCCSTADLSKEHLDRRDIHYVCFHYTLDGVQHMDDLGVSMPLNAFYTALANGSVATTSQVNLSEYMNYFTGFLEQGLDVLHVCLSSGISGSYNSAMSAAMIAREQFPDRKIYVVDSLGASSGFGLIMETLADLRDGGMNIDELHDWVEANKLRMHHWFFSTDLSFYVPGGRTLRQPAEHLPAFEYGQFWAADSAQQTARQAQSHQRNRRAHGTARGKRSELRREMLHLQLRLL